MPIVTQCFGDYFYSKAKATEVEHKFQRIEKRYCQCVDRIKSGQPLQGSQPGDLLITMLDLYVRNAIHENQTGKEGIEAYNLRSLIFTQKLLLGTQNLSYTKQAMVDHIVNFWCLEVLSVPSSHPVFTSDNPSVWHAFKNRRPGVHLVVLPLTPFHVAVAFDRRVIRVQPGEITREDVMTFNYGQIGNAGRCVYTFAEFSPENLQVLKMKLDEKPDRGCTITDGAWSLSLQTVNPDFMFSFARLNPPLF